MDEKNRWRVKALEILQVAEASADPEERFRHRLSAVALYELAENAPNPFVAICTDCHRPTGSEECRSGRDSPVTPAAVPGFAGCFWWSGTSCSARDT